MKKVLAILCAVALLMLAFPMNAFAALATPTETVSYTVGVEYATVQEAVDAAQAAAADDTVETKYVINLPAGTYGGFTINQSANANNLMSIEIVGVGDATIIDDAVRIQCEISGSVLDFTNYVRFKNICFKPSLVHRTAGEWLFLGCIAAKRVTDDSVDYSGMHNLVIEDCKFICEWDDLASYNGETTNAVKNGGRSATIGDIYFTRCYFEGLFSAYQGYLTYGQLYMSGCTTGPNMESVVNQQKGGETTNNRGAVHIDNCELTSNDYVVRASSANTLAQTIEITDSVLSSQSDRGTIVSRGSNTPGQVITIEDSSVVNTGVDDEGKSYPVLSSAFVGEQAPDLKINETYLGTDDISEVLAGWDTSTLNTEDSPVQVYSYYTDPAHTSLVVIQAAPTEQDTEVIASANASYIVVIPTLVDFGTIKRSDPIKSKDFSVGIEDALLDFGAKVTVDVTSDFAMKHEEAPTHTMPYQLFNVPTEGAALTTGGRYCSFGMEAGEGVTLIGEDYEETVMGRVITDPSALTRAGNYSDTMVFVCEYVVA